MADHNDLGEWGEDMAADMLRQKGYIIASRRWHYGKSKVDLDIVCKSADDRYCIFVEVKTREQEEVTEPEDAVDLKKIQSLGRAAHRYVQLFDVVEELRFDIVTVVGSPMGGEVKINHIEDAFNPLLV